MKPTQITELLANIRKTFVSFFSILMFVALGVGIFLGISWVTPALQNASGKVFDEGSFHHFQIQFPYGLTDDDLAQLAEVEGVTDVEPARQSFQTLPVNGESVTMKVQSLGERIDTLSVVEGELPAQAGEIALSAEAAAGCGLAVGNTVTFDSDASSGGSLGALANVEGQAQPTSDSDGMKFLNGATYKVVALVHSPEYLATASETYGYAPNVSGSVSLLGWVVPSAFDASAFQNGYPVVNVRCDGLQGLNSFAADYESQSSAIDKRIAKLGSKLADARYSDLQNQAQEKVDEAEQQLTQGKEQIAAGEQQLVDGRAELEKQRSEGEAKLSAAYQQLTMLERVKNEIAQYLEKAKRFYDEVKGALDTLGDDGVIEIDGETYTVPQLLALLPHAKGAYETLQKEYDAKVAELNAAWNEYYAGQAELNRKVAEAEQKLADGQAQLDEAKKKVAEGEPQVESAKEQVASMKDYSWTVTGRMDNAGCVNVSVFSNVTTSLSFSMAALFVIVGLLVSYSAVSRIVHEQITQIGTKKALGLRKREITTSFLMYAGLAVVFGAIVGAIVGVTAVEGIIANALSSMFILGSYPPFFGVGQFLVVTALELVLVLGATWLACRSILRKQAIELLRGEEPPTAKTRFYEKWSIWGRLPLLTQTMVNNCVNDKRRVFSTVVGVAGCTALIVTAITLNNDVLKSYDEHDAHVYGFSHIAYVYGSVAGAPDN
ncbi:MAG: FtsX-like permease family protein, partial [Eggerthellaceae bacterium]|nr:FtsX-like permease family protein [Eggerthellaceae bacterium]